MIHESSQNTSFLKTREELKKIGIKNNDFFLRLDDDTLQNVDPYSEYLDTETKLKIIKECTVNPWYFFREIVRIPGLHKYERFELNRANLASIYLFINNIDHHICTPKYTRTVTSGLGTLLYSFVLETSNTSFALMDINKSTGTELLCTMKELSNHLPLYLKEDILFNETTTEHKNNQNRLHVIDTINSVNDAENFGRGSTAEVIFFNNLEYYPHITDFLSAAGPMHQFIKAKSTLNGTKCCRISVSTPNDEKSSSNLFKEIINNGLKWDDHLYDMTLCDLKALVEDTCKYNPIYIEYSAADLRKDDRWLKDMCERLQYKHDIIAREIFLKR